MVNFFLNKYEWTNLGCDPKWKIAKKLRDANGKAGMDE